MCLNAHMFMRLDLTCQGRITFVMETCDAFITQLDAYKDYISSPTHQSNYLILPFIDISWELQCCTK